MKHISLFNFVALCTCVAALLFSTASHAEQKFVKNNWDIHYIAFPSTFIKPETAKNYQLQRSKYMALINISVLNNKTQEALKVNLQGTAKNLLGQTTRLEFKRVEEGDSVYYLAQLKYSNEEIFNFNITAQLGNRTETIKFKKKFYVD